jgi:hypothetical protein
VGERRADVHALPPRNVLVLHRVVLRGRSLRREAPLPGQRVEGTAERERRRGENGGPRAEQPLPQQPADGQRRRPQHLEPGVVRALLAQPHDVVALGRVLLLEGLQHPDGDLGHLVQQCERQLAAGGPLRVLPAFAAQRLPAHRGGVDDRLQCAGCGARQRLPASGRQVLEGEAEALARLGEPIGQVLVDELPAAPGRGGDGARGELRGGGAGDPVHELVRLVDHDDVVLREHRRVAHRVDRQQRVVRDDDVRPPGLGPRLLGEAVLADRAPGRAQALPRRHRHLPPGVVRDARDELVPVPGLGVRRPVVQARHVAAQGGDGEGVEELLLGGVLAHRVVAVQLVQAEVVPAALEDRERGRAPEQRLERLRDPGEVPVHELALQRDRGGGDDDRGVPDHRVPDRRDEVGQGLPRARAGLHREVLAAGQRLADGLRHRVLPLAARATDRRDGRLEQLGHAGEVGLGGSGRHSSTLSGAPDSPRRNRVSTQSTPAPQPCGHAP